MRRTQIYLDDEDSDLLGRASARTGASRSELIRRAVRTQYGEQSADTRLTALRASAGAWRGHTGTGADYVEDVRGDLDTRLGALGL